QSSAALVSKSGPVPVVVLGIDPGRDQAARDYLLKEGRPLMADDAGESGGILLEGGFAKANGYELGQSVRLWTPIGLTELAIVGLLELHGAATFNGGAVVFMPLSAAQRLFRLPTQINSVQIVLKDGTDENKARTDLAAQLTPGLRVQAPSA